MNTEALEELFELVKRNAGDMAMLRDSKWDKPGFLLQDAIEEFKNLVNRIKEMEDLYEWDIDNGEEDDD